MLFSLTCVVVLLEACFITGSCDGLFTTRAGCYDQKQENCDQEFTDVYKNISTSVDGTTADTYFLLYTRNNTENPEKLHKCGGRLPPNSNFNPNNRIILMGLSYLTAWCDLKIYRDWTRELLKKEDVNIIGIDNLWEFMLYDVACADLPIIARQVIVVLNNIKEQTGVDDLDVTIIGFSLGAQLAGYIGKDFKIKKIVGLDPAGPLFRQNKPADERLDASDAEFVEIMHCNAGGTLPFLGINYNAGDIDYWMNDGTIQNACYLSSAEELIFNQDFNFAFAGTLGLTPCYHLQCTKYFLSSINDCDFTGTQCDSYLKFITGQCDCGSTGEKCATFGKYPPQNETDEQKRYYVKTTLDYPYCVSGNNTGGPVTN